MRRFWYAASSSSGRRRRAQLLDERALLAEERAAEAGDERAQDLALIDLVVAQPEAAGSAVSRRRAFSSLP